MSEPKYKPGDVVMLTSGGAKMTVTSFISPYICAWHDVNGILSQASFHEENLMLASDYPEEQIRQRELELRKADIEFRFEELEAKKIHNAVNLKAFKAQQSDLITPGARKPSLVR